MTNDVYQLSVKKEINIHNSDDDDFEDPNYDFENYVIDKVKGYILPCQQKEKLIVNKEEITPAESIVQDVNDSNENSSKEVSKNKFTN